MDMNFTDTKKEATNTADDIFAPKTVEQLQHGKGGGGVTSDNAHTEDYFANERKEADFEHIDPQTFVQRMSAGAKEAQEQLDAKFTQHQNDYDDFLKEATRDLNNFGQQLKQDTKQNVNAATQDFMNIERGLLADVAAAGDAKTLESAEKPIKHILDDTFGIADAPNAPLQPFKDNDVVEKDSDTDTPSVSFNPSPAKKPLNVTDALKEQENEKFISSEDLLGDLKDGLKQISSDFNKTAVLKAEHAHIPTTDLDAEDESEFKIASQAKAAADVPVPAKPLPTPVFNTKAAAAEPLTPAPAPAPAPATAGAGAGVMKTSTAGSASATVTAPVKGDEKHKMLGVEEMFCKYGLDAWFKPERLHPLVESLIYWRDVKKSGIVFAAGLIALLAISCFSVISVFAYLSLLTLAATVSYRTYKSITQAIQKTSDGHPFKDYLEIDLTLSQEKVQNIAGIVVAYVNGFVTELRRLFLVEDLVDSIKFGLLLWTLTYIGALFNGMTLVILAFVSLFTLPKVYENNKQSIDTYLELVRSKLAEVTEKIKAAIPIGNKKPIVAEADKDK